MANENIRVGANMSSFDKAMDNSAKNAEKAFDDIVKSVKTTDTNVKKELSQITKAMTSMLANGVNPASEAYQQLAQRAGALQDAISDAREEIRAQADDTRNMTLTLGALGDGLSVFTAAQASMSLFGVESKDATKAIQKMMAAQQVLNAVQAVGNSLTSKSTLLGKAYAAIKSTLAIGAGAQAAAEGTAAVATTGLATAEGGATVATGALSVALNSLPFVAIISAIGIVTLGLVEMAKSLLGAGDEAENTKEALDSLTEINGQAAKSYADGIMQLDRYRILLENFVGTQEDEKRMVDDLNKKYGEHLGLYKDIQGWKDALITQGRWYCEMLEEEARAQAIAAKMGELYAQHITEEIDLQSYNAQIVKLRKAWEDTIITVGAYKNLLKPAAATPTGGRPTGGRPTNRGGGGARSITDGLHTMEQVDSLIDDLTKKMQGESDLAKKLDISKQLKQVQSYKESVEAITPLVMPNVPGMGAGSLAGLGIPEPEELKGRLAKVDEAVAEWQAQEVARVQELQSQFADFTGNLSGNVGGMVEDFSMLAKMFEFQGVSATDAAAGLVVMGDALKQLGGNGAAAKAGAVLASIGQIILGFSQASAQAGSLGPFGWLAFVGAGLAAVASTISTVKGFNEGGIVRGAGSYDTVPAMLTPGEVVLTRNDQARLWRMLKTGGGPAGAVPEVDFIIRGSDLVAQMRNYNNIYGKVD